MLLDSKYVQPRLRLKSEDMCGVFIILNYELPDSISNFMSCNLSLFSRSRFVKLPTY